MGDFSIRAIDVLRSVHRILAEDTRHSRHLLERYDIATPVESYHEHNEARAAPAVVGRLQAGDDFALISDAGTPLLSDPGARLVRAAIDAGVAVVPVPGASALLAALVASGFDAGRFTFLGFLPRKGTERSRMLREIAAAPHTTILYEAPARVAGTLAELAAVVGSGRKTVVARELTKQYEELRRGTLDELGTYYRDSPPRGEVVIILEGRPDDPLDEDALRAAAAEMRRQGLSARDVVAALVEQKGAPRNLAYRLAHE